MSLRIFSTNFFILIISSLIYILIILQTTGIFYIITDQNAPIIYCHKIYPLKIQCLPSKSQYSQILHLGNGFSPRNAHILLIVFINLCILSPDTAYRLEHIRYLG